MVPGSAMLTDQFTTPREFLEPTLGELRAQILGWAQGVEADSPWFDADEFRGFILLDIEHPLNPKRFWEWFEDDDDPTTNFVPANASNPDYQEDDGTPILLDHILQGFNLRIAAARDVFRHAKIAVYPMVFVRGDGLCTRNTENNIAAWEYASTSIQGVPRYNTADTFSRNSWLDEIDYVLVQLYPRYGPCEGDAAFYNKTTTQQFVRLGMEIGKRIADMEAGVGVLPLLAFGIHNAGPESNEPPDFPVPESPSCDDKETATLEYLRWQVEEIRRYAFAGPPASGGEGIGDLAICFWSGEGQLGAPARTEPGEPTDIFDFMDKLCFSICDLNGTSYYDDDPMAQQCMHPDDDSAFWAGAIDDPLNPPVNPFHMVFDVDGNRVVVTSGAANVDVAIFNAACGQ